MGRAFAGLLLDSNFARAFILCAQDHKPIRVYNVLMMLEYFAQVVPVYCFIASRTAIKSLAWET